MLRWQVQHEARQSRLRKGTFSLVPHAGLLTYWLARAQLRPRSEGVRDLGDVTLCAASATYLLIGDCDVDHAAQAGGRGWRLDRLSQLFTNPCRRDVISPSALSQRGSSAPRQSPNPAVLAD